MVIVLSQPAQLRATSCTQTLKLHSTLRRSLEATQGHWIQGIFLLVLQSGQQSPPPVRFDPWHDSDSSGFYGRRDSMSTDGGGSFSSARSFNSAWSGGEGDCRVPIGFGALT